MIGSAGRLCPVKDYSFMIDVAKAVKEGTRHIKFHLAGEGPERAKLQAIIQQYNLNETFVLQGHLDDMLPFYRSPDLSIRRFMRAYLVSERKGRSDTILNSKF